MSACVCCGRWFHKGADGWRVDGGRMHPACWDEHHSHPDGAWPEGHECAGRADQ